MDVIVKKQYSLRNQPFYKLLGFSVGLVDSDTQSLSFYSQKLTEANLLVEAVGDLDELNRIIADNPIYAVVFNPSVERIDRDINALRNFAEQNPQLPIITMAKTMQEMQINAIMKAGTRLHINRDLSHPRDLLIALEQILTK